MKTQLRNIARSASQWPLVGRFVRTAVAIIRLPDLNQRQYLFETEQLPTLLQALSDLNHRQLANPQTDNLVKSVPVALRKLTRDLAQLQAELERLAADPSDRMSMMEHKQDETSHVVSYLLGRVEFIRRELMFEMRYGASKATPQARGLKAKTEVLNLEKLEAARKSGLRLNLGCGHIPLEGYVNVDRRALPGVDIVAEVDELPFGSGEVDEIFSAHLLEHFPQEELRRVLLPYFFDLLKEGGKLHAVVPDAEAMIREYSKGEYPYEKMRDVFYGAQDYDGDFHFNMFTPESLTEMLKSAGLSDVRVLNAGRKNGDCYEFEILGKK